MGEIDQELEKVHKELLDLRRFERLLRESDFKNLIRERSDDDKKEILQWLKDKDRTKLVKWIRAQNKDLETLGVRDLRKLASRYQIVRYGTMTRRELILALRRLQDVKSNGAEGRIARPNG